MAISTCSTNKLKSRDDEPCDARAGVCDTYENRPLEGNDKYGVIAWRLCGCDPTAETLSGIS